MIGGDVILEVVGIKITPDTSSMKSIRNKVQEIGEGDAFFVKVLRAGETKVLKIILQ